MIGHRRHLAATAVNTLPFMELIIDGMNLIKKLSI
jgi:hypothetical protein